MGVDGHHEAAFAVFCHLVCFTCECASKWSSLYVDPLNFKNFNKKEKKGAHSDAKNDLEARLFEIAYYPPYIGG